MILRKKMWADSPNTEWQEYLTPFELKHGCFDGDGGGDGGGGSHDDGMGSAEAWAGGPGEGPSHDDGMGGADIWGSGADSGGVFSGGPATSDFDGDVSMTTGDLGLGGDFNYGLDKGINLGPAGDPNLDIMNMKAPLGYTPSASLGPLTANGPLGYTPSASLGTLGIRGETGPLNSEEEDETWKSGWDLTQGKDGNLRAAEGFANFARGGGFEGDTGSYSAEHLAEAQRLNQPPSAIEPSPLGGFTLKGANIGTGGFTKGDLMGRSIADQISDTLGLDRGADVNAYLNPELDASTYNPYVSMFDRNAPLTERIAHNWPMALTTGTGVGLASWLSSGLGRVMGDSIRGTGEDPFGRGYHVHDVDPEGPAAALGFEDGYLTAISPEDEIGYTAGADGSYESPQQRSAPAPSPAVAAAVERLTEPAGLNLTGTDAQKLAQLATIGVAGGTGQGVARSEEGQEFFKQLVRDVYGDAGELVAAGNVRPIELQYLSEVMGGISEPEVSAFLRAIG